MATDSDETQDGGSIVVPLAGGGFALIWSRFDRSTDEQAVMLRYFDADGTAASGEIALLPGASLHGLSAIPLAQGGFLLTRGGPIEPDGSGSLLAQAYDEAGNEVGPEMRTTSAGGLPAAVQLVSGGYAIGWEAGQAIHIQRFDSGGARTGPEILIEADGSQEPVDMAATADGGFAAAWMQGPEFFGQPYLVKAQFFSSTGAPSGRPITVETARMVETPTIVTLVDGSLVLGWAEYQGSNTFQLKALPIGADGRPSGPVVTLATYRSESQFGPEPSFAAHPDGGFVAMWPQAEDYPNNRIYHRFEGQQFDSSGRPIGPLFVPGDFADGGDIAVLADGTIAAAWYGPDAYGQGLFARVYRPADERQATSGDDVLYGDGGANWIDGLGGDDTLHGLGGDDELLGRSGNDRLNGGTGDDLLRGGAGNDVLDGGPGCDEMRGGDGDDLYFVDGEGDRVVERAGAGIDEIRTGLAVYSLFGLPDVENLTATSNVAHDFRGNPGSNVITGGAGNDLIRLNDGGDDTAFGGDGNDVFYFGGALRSADRVDGGAGRDSIVLQETLTVVLSNTSLVNIESISLQSGSNPKFGDTTNAFYDFNVTTADGNVAAGQQLIVNGQSLRAGEDLTFNGSAETDGRFLIYGGHGTDILKGGAGADVFFFEGDRWGPNDRVDGGGGRDAVVISGGTGLKQVTFGASSLTNVESISVNATLASDPSAKPSYAFVLHNGNVTPGGNLIVNGNSLTDPSQTLSVDGSAVQGGTLTLFGGAGNDTFKGGAGADLLYGGGGRDNLTGGAGADLFQLRAASESTVANPDRILDFQAGADKIDLRLVDANSALSGDQAFTFIGANAFNGTAGQLRAYQSAGTWFVEGDTDGNGVADFALAVTASAPLGQGDFLL
jgi:Ca2+-binding RTX toxin-like protein